MSRKTDKSILIIGLNRFGSSLSLELMNHGWEVLAVDIQSRRVQAHADALTHTVMGDATDEAVLHQIGVSQFARAVVAIGNHLEESILTTSLLVDAKIPSIWARATSRRHGRILEQLGAHHVVLPEHDMGERVAHLVSGRILDYVEIDEGFSLVKAAAPHKILGRPLGRVGMRQEHGVTVVAVKQPEGSFVHATQETVLQENDIIVVAGKTEDVDRFTKAG